MSGRIVRMSTKKATHYRVAGAIVLLVLGVLIVVWAARSHLFHQPSRRPSPSDQGRQAGIPSKVPPPASLTSQERNSLLELARKTLQQVVATGSMPTLDPYDLPDNLREKKGCFVTLKKNGQLRGCIGYIFPLEPLYRAVMDNACAAAIKDRRFDPVRPEELEAIEIEISVLTVPQPLEFDSPTDLLTQLRPNVDGVVLRIGGRQSTYLPQVWEQLSDKERFLSYLSAKAGCQPLAWKEPGTSVLTYQAEAFKESDM